MNRWHWRVMFVGGPLEGVFATIEVEEGRLIPSTYRTPVSSTKSVEYRLKRSEEGHLWHTPDGAVVFEAVEE